MVVGTAGFSGGSRGCGRGKLTGKGTTFERFQFSECGNRGVEDIILN